MLLKIHPQNPDKRKINEVVNILKKGGVIIYPTDTVYGIGCDIFNTKAIERICQLKGTTPEKAQFSFICSDLSHLSEYTKPIDNAVYRMMKKTLPGPYTFVLEANNQVPKLLKSKRKTVGIRVPDNSVCQSLIQELGNPILSTSLTIDPDAVEYTTDPELIFERYKNKVDIVIDAGIGGLESSTVIDCSTQPYELIRQGLGDTADLF